MADWILSEGGLQLNVPASPSSWATAAENVELRHAMAVANASFSQQNV
jgi:hypothetical protein